MTTHATLPMRLGSSGRGVFALRMFGTERRRQDPGTRRNEYELQLPPRDSGLDSISDGRHFGCYSFEGAGGPGVCTLGVRQRDQRHRHVDQIGHFYGHRTRVVESTPPWLGAPVTEAPVRIQQAEQLAARL